MNKDILKHLLIIFLLLCQTALAQPIRVPRAPDPIAWRIDNLISSPVFLNTKYSEKYVLTSNQVAVMNNPLLVVKTGSPEFTYHDKCSNRLLAPQESCEIIVNFFSTALGIKTSQLTLRYNHNVVPLPVQSLEVRAGRPILQGNVDPSLPTLVSPNTRYPVSFHFANGGTLAATQVRIEKHYPAFFAETADNCQANVLKPGDSCTISGQLTPPARFTASKLNERYHKNKISRNKPIKALRVTQNTEIAVSVALNYAEGEKLLLTTRGVSSTIAVDGSVDKALPANSLVGHTYPVQFSLKNNSNVAISKLVVTRKYPEGVFQETSNTCGTSLAAKASCKVEGTFTARQENAYVVGLNFSYKEGEPVYLNTFTTTRAITVAGDINPSLPPNSVIATEYPIQFNFTNNNDTEVTGIKVIKSYPSEFSESEDTCGSSLLAHTTCYIKGNYLAKDLSAPNPTLTTTFSYLEGAPVTLSVNSKLNEVVLNGEVINALPSISTIGISYPVQFKFNNPSEHAITGAIVHNQLPKDFNIISDDCSDKKVFLAKESCVIEGELTPQSTIDYQVSSSISYDQGPDISVKTSTLAIAVEVDGEVDQALPRNTNLNTRYPVSFSFSNISAGIATEINLTKDYPNDFHEETNTCGKTLQAGSSCVVQGTLTPQSPGTKTVGLQFSYHEGKSIPLQTVTDVNDVAIVGAIKQGLPNAAAINTPYNAIFEFHNTGPSPAHGVKLKNLDSVMIIIDNTCNAILAADQHCKVVGEFYTSQEGSHKAGVSLSYQEGENIDLLTSTHVGKALLVAVGLEGYSSTSQNGKAWEKLNLPQNINLTSITWSDDLQKYLAVGTERNNGIALLSTDGKNWDQYYTTSARSNRVIWNKTLQQFISVGRAGIIETSDTGQRWMRRPVPVSNSLNSVIWSEALHQYVVVGTYGVILTSTNGVNWQTQLSTVSDNLTGIAWSDTLKKYIVVTTTQQLFLISSNGKDWQTYKTAALDRPTYDVTWSADLYQFASAGRFSTICTTNNGTTWAKRNSVSGGLLSYSLNNIIWSHNLNAFFAVDLNAYLYTSNNAINWNYLLLDGNSIDGGRGITGISDGVLLAQPLKFI